MLITKSYKYRIYPTKQQTTTFEQWLTACRHLYNTALQQRRDEYKAHKRNVTFFDQSKQLPQLKKAFPHYAELHSQILQDVLHRVDKTFQAFFARCSKGLTPGYPRFKGYNQYDSFSFPQGGWSLHNNRLTLSKLERPIKVKLHRSLLGKVKTCTIKREAANKWFVVFVVEQEVAVPTSHAGSPVGIDLGLEYFASLSTGEQVANPRPLRKAQTRLAKVQRHLANLKQLPTPTTAKEIASRQQKLAKAKAAIARTHQKVANQRKDFAFKLVKTLTDSFSFICLEDLQVANLIKRPKPKEDEYNPCVYLPNGASAKAGLNKSINDAGWTLFTGILAHKAASAGVRIVKVNPAYTSQTCPNCQTVKPKELSERWHSCQCGCQMPRDVAAALVILSRGLATVGANP